MRNVWTLKSTVGSIVVNPLMSDRKPKYEYDLSMFRPDKNRLKSYQSVLTSILEILKLRLDVPPTGTRSLPVVKWSSFFCSSSGNASTTSQKNLLPPTQPLNTYTHTHIPHANTFSTGVCLYIALHLYWQYERNTSKIKTKGLTTFPK